MLALLSLLNSEQLTLFNEIKQGQIKLCDYPRMYIYTMCINVCQFGLPIYTQTPMPELIFGQYTHILEHFYWGHSSNYISTTTSTSTSYISNTHKKSMFNSVQVN